MSHNCKWESSKHLNLSSHFFPHPSLKVQVCSKCGLLRLAPSSLSELMEELNKQHWKKMGLRRTKSDK